MEQCQNENLSINKEPPFGATTSACSLPGKQRYHIFRGTSHLRELMFSDLSFLERDRTSILCMSRTEYLKSF